MKEIPRGPVLTRRAVVPALAIGAVGVAGACDAKRPEAASDDAPEKRGTEQSAFPFLVVSTRYGGTLGDGDDQQCIQNTLDAANAEGGGIVVLPPRPDGYVYRYSQLVIPRWVHFRGSGWYSFGADASQGRLQQLPGINDDSIVFSDSGDDSVRPFAGPFGLTDIVLRGAPGSTSGHAISLRTSDGRIAGLQDLTSIERIQIRGFAGSGVYVRKGSPVRLRDITTLWNGGFGVEVEDTGVDVSTGSVHEVTLETISGDGNMGYQPDGGGATVVLKHLSARRASVVLRTIKSEYRIRPSEDSGDDTSMGNFNAVVIENCACPVTVIGVMHIASGPQNRRPGNAIQIKGPARPDLVWLSVAVRDDHPTQTVGNMPYRVFDEAVARGSAAPHGALGASTDLFEADHLAAQIDTERRDELATGESILPRRSITSSSATLVAGALRLTFFTARKTEEVTRVRTYSGPVPAEGATLHRIGVYEVDSSDNLKLLAATENDTSLWTEANAKYDSAFESGFSKKRGARYAVGALVVGAATPPDLLGQSQLHQDEGAQPPRLCASLDGQSDLPAEIQADSLSPSPVQVYAALIP